MHYVVIFLKTLASWAAILFLWFLLSGTPLFVDPKKLDGKSGPGPTYACFSRHGFGRCSSEIYWQEAPRMAAFLTLGTLVQPFAYRGWLATLPETIPYYLLPVGLFIFFQRRSTTHASVDAPKGV